MYRKEIVTYDIVFTEAEHDRMKAIRDRISKMLKMPMYEDAEMVDLLSELEQILEGEWCEPMPF